MFHLARIFVVLVIGVNSVKCQDGTDEELAVVTLEMFEILQAEVKDLYGYLDSLQGQLQTLATNIENLATDSAVVGTVELAELQALIDVSNKQEEDILKLISANAMWQQNFRVVNATFEKLRKVAVFPNPTLNNPPIIPNAARRLLPAIKQRPNVTLLQTPKPKLIPRKKVKQ